MNQPRNFLNHINLYFIPVKENKQENLEGLVECNKT